ncbi:Sodium/calcium exchanger protein-domain-containing protein [Parachaetomium inaequale]|uniref:Sodium/calcium exchanger protein-domain-containing protein n=1 Tax=Parachaetomium inaequale TaxID=2588326 RepID=A0AAN6SNU6_9PEZI|nr:Sodium/calcium exchanger protein-domain-containing protein [Parachaetomium inaequale]
MSPSRPTRRRYGARPAVAATLLVAVIAALALLQSTPGISSNRYLRPRGLRANDADCRDVHHAADQCAFILANCEDDEAGLIHYLSFYYCTLGRARPVAFAVLALWLGLLFTTIGIAASDFFSVNLSTIASVLGLSESLAGVTFLAFGNGSPDVFSTFAAMGSNSGSMAVGELIGAAGFITAVVAGSMALVREFKVSKRTFVRDIVFFIVAVSFTMVFLADGELHLWECFTMIGFYVFYVIVVVGWHWFTARRRRQRLRDVAARAHLYGASGHGSDELEPYRDEPDEDEAAPVGGGRSNSAPEPGDISILERGPRIEVDGVPSSTDDDEEEERGIHVAAEMASSMRVNRPRWGRSNTTITPIRPSLLGVLEFRSVLSSLQKERNMHLGPLHGRSHSIQQPATAGLEDPRGRPRNKTMPAHVPAGPRERALSYGNEPLHLENAGLARPDSSSMPQTRTSSAARTIDGRLAPPLGAAMPVDRDSQSPKQTQQLLQIRIPSPSGRSSGSGHSSPSISPFPGLSESPAVLTPFQDHRAFSFPPPLDARRQSFPAFDDQEEEPKPVRWWPYSVLPAPHVLLATIFPTLQGWREKTLWDKVVSLISVPSIFFLVATLPVVETENEDDDSEADIADPPEADHPGNTAPAVVVEDGSEIQPETEWQAYRRRTRSVTSRSPLSLSPSSLSLHTPRHPDQQPPSLTLPVPQQQQQQQQQQPPKLPPQPASDHPTTTTTSNQPPTTAGSWNRWLVAVQLFTGPLFVVSVLWANTADDMPSPRRTLLHMVLYSLLVSLCLLAALLATTTPSQKPKYHFLLCFLGFIISVAWISTIAGEVVGVLKAFGVILDISEAILGLTVFAVGNSLGDLVADVTVARLGYPVMALAACFGGPMLNILLGVGIGGAWMGISKAKKRQRQNPGSELRYRPYRIRVGGTLTVSAVTVLVTLVVLLVVVPGNGWVMSRRIGWGLIGIWTVGTVVNLVVEMTGTFAEVAGGG